MLIWGFVAEFYGLNPPEANLQLLARFFEKYPDYKERAFLSVKVTSIAAHKWLARADLRGR